MNLKLALFDFCPYCQRVRILLEHYKLPHELVRIDPHAPPPWFAQASPQGRAPVLAVDGTPIIESAIIGELVDALGGGGLFPPDPVARAQTRIWIERVSDCQAHFGAMIRAADKAAFAAARDNLQQVLLLLEQSIDAAGCYFRDNALSMVDVVLAPLLMRMRLLQPVLPCFPADHPRLLGLAKTLEQLPEVDRSVDGNAAGVFGSMVAHLNAEGYVANHWSS